MNGPPDGSLIITEPRRSKSRRSCTVLEHQFHVVGGWRSKARVTGRADDREPVAAEQRDIAGQCDARAERDPARAEALGGKGGGGRPDMAQAGGPDGAKASAALDAIETAMAGA